VRRNVDPGSFVQNATTGASEVLIAIARTDLLTVTAAFPDNAAPLIAEDTPVEVVLDDFPDAAITARVSRFSPSIRNNDRTMRVEVDRFNGTPAEHQRFAAHTVAVALAPLADGGPLAAAASAAWSQSTLWGQRKSASDSLPPPALTGTASPRR